MPKVKQFLDGDMGYMMKSGGLGDLTPEEQTERFKDKIRQLQNDLPNFAELCEISFGTFKLTKKKLLFFRCGLGEPAKKVLGYY